MSHKKRQTKDEPLNSKDNVGAEDEEEDEEENGGLNAIDDVRAPLTNLFKLLCIGRRRRRRGLMDSMVLLPQGK